MAGRSFANGLAVGIDEVGADDGGSSTAVMLEVARNLCAQHGRYQVWIAFFDGEEAVNLEWKDPDNRYGSRQMAAKLNMSGDLKNIRAFILADIVGSRELLLKRDSNSDKSLNDLVWATANHLGYSGVFVNMPTAIDDDHQSFSTRGVKTVDIIDLEIPYWHTPQDTLDKISSKSLAVVGHVILETLKMEPLSNNRTRVTIQSVFQSVADRDGMVASGVESGTSEAHQLLDDLLAKLQPTAATVSR